MPKLSLKKLFFCKFLEIWLRTLRISIENEDILLEKGVLALWHQDLFALTAAFASSGWVAFISPSRDGEILAKIGTDLGYRVVRGSSSEGTIAIRQTLSLLKSRNVCAMALDGPRGPAGIEKPGSRWLAKKANSPIWIAKVQYGKHFTLSSWDKAKIPFPLSKLTIRLSYL